jgi:hypothetical protein
MTHGPQDKRGRLQGILLFVCVFAFLASAVRAGDKAIVIDDFEQGLKSHWKVKKFKGETIYRVVDDHGNHVLKAESNASASGLLYQYSYSVKEYPILTWQWKVENTIKKGDATKKSGDDYAARVYVIFPHWLPTLTRSINYIWANKLPKGEHIPNPYQSRAVMVAVESGAEHVGSWVSERRNVYEDYKKIFNEEPPLVGGIAIMTDTDNTGESAVTYYDNLIIEKK